MKKEGESLGATFTGEITVNGPMFDIHDNEQVHIHMNKPETEDDSEDNVDKVIPEPLRSEAAEELLEALVDAELLDENWQPRDLSGTEKGELAMQVALRLNIREVWQVFGSLWGVKPTTLRAAFNKGRDQAKNAAFQDRLKRILAVGD